MPELDQYLWCGHAVIVGKARNDWQERDYVLRWFGKKEGEAKRTYRRYVGRRYSVPEQKSRSGTVLSFRF